MLKSRLDDLGYMGFVARNNTLLKAMNASTCVREQFVAWHLRYQGNLISVKPFDGLDKMLCYRGCAGNFLDQMTSDLFCIIGICECRIL